MSRSFYTYDNWMADQEAQGLPVYRQCYVEDLNALDLGHWQLRGCAAALIQFTDMDGVTEARVQEVPAGGSLQPFKLGVDEMVYVLSGRGNATVWGDRGGPKRSFEWSTRSIFVIPRNAWCQLRSMEGDRPARLLHFNYLPLAMTVMPEPDFFFNNSEVTTSPLDGATANPFSEASTFVKDFGSGWGRMGNDVWRGNFFPDLLAWDKLQERAGRGAGGSSVYMYVPASEMSCHLSVFPTGTYKKGHRHGPGRLIVIPGGEGFTIMWPAGGEKQVFWWKEGSALTPPDQWYHQHFNVSNAPARYLALHPPVQFIGKEDEEGGDASDQNIEYVDEDPWIREYFENALAERGLKSAMPPECYADPNFKFKVSSSS